MTEPIDPNAADAKTRAGPEAAPSPAPTLRRPSGSMPAPAAIGATLLSLTWADSDPGHRPRPCGRDDPGAQSSDHR